MTRGRIYGEIKTESEGNPERKNPRDFLSAQALFHRVSQLESQYIYSQYISSIVLPRREILKELILCIAITAGAIFSRILPALPVVYWKI